MLACNINELIYYVKTNILYGHMVHIYNNASYTIDNAKINIEYLNKLFRVSRAL